MGDRTPKQYLQINGRSVLEHTISRLLEFGIEQIVVAVDPQDQLWQSIALSNDPRLQFVEGGASRGQSVLLGLERLCEMNSPDQFVMVHDAVRPCVSIKDLAQLLKLAGEHEIGGLLALPITDTLKKGSSEHPPTVEQTIARDRVWRALTPQMFRLGPLTTAIVETLGDERVTDEASAVELCGYVPLLIKGSSTNIKITYPDDLDLARHVIMAESELQ